jgi:hypothetical protein
MQDFLEMFSATGETEWEQRAPYFCKKCKKIARFQVEKQLSRDEIDGGLI